MIEKILADIVGKQIVVTDERNRRAYHGDLEVHDDRYRVKDHISSGIIDFCLCHVFSVRVTRRDSIEIILL